MKKLYALLLLQIILEGVNAQTNINVCSFYCSRDLSGHITGLSINEEPVEMSYAKENLPQTDVDVNYQVEPNPCPANGDDDAGGEVIENAVPDPICTDIRPSLKFDVYYPINHAYNTCKLPALIMFHGGAYAECSDKRNKGIVALCKEFAYRGFVVFSVEYRRGVLRDNRTITDILSGKTINYTTAQQMLAIYRACQDARGAIRSIIKYEKNGWGSGYPWRIDIGKIFVGGISAGSVVAMHSVYFQNQGQWNDVFQSSIVSALGYIDGNDYYYAGAETPFPDYTAANGIIAGVLDCWGALMVPATVAYNTNPFSFFSSNTVNPPLIGFHGKEDETFHFNRQALYFSKTKNGYLLHQETHCVAVGYTVNNNNDFPGAILLGTQSIYNMFKLQTSPYIFTEFYLDCQMEHGLDKIDDINCVICGGVPSMLSTCLPCGYQSNFGGNFGTAAQTYNYMAGRGATFMQAIMGGSSTSLLSTVSKFVECINTRVTCTGTPASACSNNDACGN